MSDAQPCLGIVGAGIWGSNHIATAARLGLLRAVCDADPAQLQKVRSEYPNVATTTQLEELLQMPLDGVIIATPAETHARFALTAIAAGMHVFVEKPLALSVAGAQAVVTAARDAGRYVFVGHLVLYQQGVRAVLERVRSGSIGQVLHVRARRASFGRLRYVEDVWWSFAPHDVATMLAIVGEEPLEASGIGHSYATPGIADFAYADYTFSGGRTAHIESTWLDPFKGASLDVFGSEGTLSLREGRSETTLRIVPSSVRRTAGARAQLWRGEESTLTFPGDDPLRTELQAFVGMIARGSSVPTDGAAGLQVVRALALASAGSQVAEELYEGMPA